jgi:hypothetical protein
MRVLGISTDIWRRLYTINLVIIALIAVIGFSLPAAHAQNVTIDSTRNCDANAVIFCGAGSVNQLINKFDNGDGHNSAASIHDIFSFFGVSAADVHSMANSGVEVHAGNVTRSGDVFDGSGHLVATNALTAGRQDMAGSTRQMANGTVFFVRPPSVSFVSSPLRAFVVMQNGRFAFAVLASCGNVVKATPTLTPKPTPTPTPTPKPTKPAQPTPTSTTTTTSVCSGNTTNSSTATASQGGNCSTNTTVVQQTQQAAQTTPAPSTQSATQTAAPPTQTVAQTAAPATVTAPVTTTPTPTALVNTGPGSIVGVFAATASLGTLAYRWFIGRKLQQNT